LCGKSADGSVETLTVEPRASPRTQHFSRALGLEEHKVLGDRLFGALLKGDPDGELSASLLAKELLLEVYAAKTQREAHSRLQDFYSYAARADVDELTWLSRTISRGEERILDFHVTHISTGPVVAQNLITEKIRRIGHGFRNFDNYRLRLLLHSGVKWETRPTTRIRGRSPCLIA